MGNERVRKTNEDGKKNNNNCNVIFGSKISSGGCGNSIAGLLVFGGALAIGGYVVVSSLHSFVTNRRQTKAKAKSAIIEPEPKPQPLSLDKNIKSQNHGDDHETEATPYNDEDTESACHVTSKDSISQALILEKTDPDLNTSNEVVSPDCFHHHHEIVLSDYSHPESVASSSNENGMEEECSASLSDNSSSKAQEDEPQHSLDSPQSETKDNNDDDDDNNIVLENDEEKEDSSKATDETSLNSGSQAQEDEPQRSLDSPQSETKDDDDNDDNSVVLENEEEEKEKDSSKAIAETSLNSNKEEAEKDLKGEEGTTESDIQTTEAVETDISNSADASLFAETSMATNPTPPESTSNEKANLSVGLNYQPSPSPSYQLITSLMPTLLQALLLLLALFTCSNFFSYFTK